MHLVILVLKVHKNHPLCLFLYYSQTGVSSPTSPTLHPKGVVRRDEASAVRAGLFRLFVSVDSETEVDCGAWTEE